MTTHHVSINCEDDIPDMCKSIFLSSKQLISTAWVIAVLFVAGYGAAVSYAIGTSVAIAKVESKVAEQSHSLYILNEQINKKLDLLINKKP